MKRIYSFSEKHYRYRYFTIVNIKFLLSFLVVLISLSSCNFENKEWEKAKSSNTLDVYKSFVNKYPNGKYTDDAKKKIAQEWWSVKVLSVTRNQTESLGDDLNKTIIEPVPGEAVAKIDLEVIALSGEIGKLRERLLKNESFLNPFIIDYLSGIKPEALSGNAVGLLHNPADVSKIETQLFLSKYVNILIDTFRIMPLYAHFENEYGITMTDTDFSVVIQRFDPQKHNVVYLLRPHLLAAWFQTNKKVKLTLYFSVPANINSARLKFYDLPPIQLWIN